MLLLVSCKKDSIGIVNLVPVGEPVAAPMLEFETGPIDEISSPDRKPLVTGARSHDGIQAILGTADLGVGINRVGLLLTSLDGIVTHQATVESRYVGFNRDGNGVVVETLDMEFQPWPYGLRGLHTAHFLFDRSGWWAFDISVNSVEESIRKTEIYFEVAQTTSAPAKGTYAPLTRSKTIDDVGSLDAITTGSLQDPDLYQLSLDEAVQNGLPTVVVFASPAFCTNAVCGPQVEVLQGLKDKYLDRANFVHVDFYDNPMEIRGDLDQAVISPTVLQWGLPSIEWTFVIDRQGIVVARFEAFATVKEIEQVLLDIL